MNVKSILICPECRCSLNDNLECNNCNNVYTYKNGVFDVVSQKLSNNQKILWNITDEMIKDEKTSELSNTKKEPDWVKDYISRKNSETLEAEKKLYSYSERLIEAFSGTVCDLATGMGGMLERLLNSKNKAFEIVCTDIDKHILMWTRKIKHTDDKRVSYVATDGRYLSIKNNSFDVITSIAAFGNIPESDKVANELYRTLKPNGKVMIVGNYIEKGSRSFELAKSRGLEKGLVEEFLIDDLEKAGFKNITSTVVAKALWAENPYDLLPVANDMNYYCVIQAEKA
jgi:ubiquinone/menaquinone biosynthesis C-methylase UbiE